MINRLLRHGAAKPVIFTACLLPLGWLVWSLFGDPSPSGAIVANPQEYLNRYLGDWALRLLLAALALTPLRGVTRVNSLMRFRRMLGLYAFFYACLHVVSYAWLDQGLNWPELWKDIIKRTYITVGMASFILLLPLALTSWNAMIRRLGARRWRRLHQLVYVIAPLVCLHFFMMRKGFQVEPVIYGVICIMLLVYRIKDKYRR